MSPNNALAAIANTFYDQHTTWIETHDEIDKILRSVDHGPTQEGVDESG